MRDTYFDFLRGIAIIMVIGIHTYHTESATCFQLFLRQLIYCAVPLFLAISGYFLGKKDVNTRNKFAIVLRKQIPKVYIPMLIFSIPWILLHFYYQGWKDIISTILLSFIGGISIFYFIPLIIQYYLLLPLFIRFTDGHYKLGALFFTTLTLFSTGIIIYLQYFKCMDLPLILRVAPFPIMIVFYYLGVLFARVDCQKLAIRLKFLFCASLVALSLCYFEIYILSRNGHIVAGMKVSSQILAVVIILILFQKTIQSRWRLFSENVFSKLIQFIGRVSFFIYLSHLIFKVILNYFLSIENWYINWIIIVFISTLIAYFALILTPLRFHKYIGL